MMVRSPKAYLRDSGLLHSLLGLTEEGELLGHPAYGASWEGFAIENILGALGPGWRVGFYRTAAGAELDLVLERANERLAVECKASSAPTVSRGFWTALEDLKVKRAFVVAPIKEPFPLGRGAMALPLDELLRTLVKLAP